MKTMLALPLATLALLLAACSDGDNTADAGPIPLTVPKASCGASDKVETALQGQVPAAIRTPGAFKGFNCNLELQGQSRGDGASWVSAKFQNCYYHDTASATAGRTNLGVVALDVTNSRAPTPTAYLTTRAMLDPWESLKVNERRQLLGAVNALNGNGGPEIDLYDLSADCKQPQLLSSTSVGLPGGGGIEFAVRGHEGDFSIDGLTYYGSNLGAGYVYAIDITSTVKPKLLATWTNPYVARLHGQTTNPDGTRLYLTSAGVGAADITRPPPPATFPNNGLIIVDTSDIQSRKANPVIREVGHVFWDDARTAQGTIYVKIAGKPHIIFFDEGGGGANSDAGRGLACDAGLAAWPMARLIDVSDEKNPKVVSKLALEIHDPKNCAKVRPDVADLGGFTYGAHYCGVDDTENTTAVACGYFESGIRVFDVRDPTRPKEIAYFNPASVTTPSPGSQNVRTAAQVTGRPDHCSAPVHFDKAKGEIWTTCQDNGFLSLKFTNNAWPFR